jgi:hypothetical protein
MISAQSRQALLGKFRELGFPIRRNKKYINSRPSGWILIHCIFNKKTSTLMQVDNSATKSPLHRVTNIVKIIFVLLFMLLGEGEKGVGGGGGFQDSK